MGKFYETLATLMTLQLQILCLKSIYEYTDFICNVRVSWVSQEPPQLYLVSLYVYVVALSSQASPGFQIHVLYKNNKIMFNPPYKELKHVLLNVFAELIKAVSEIPRIETKLFVENFEKYDSMYLKVSTRFDQVLPFNLEKIAILAGKLGKS